MPGPLTRTLQDVRYADPQDPQRALDLYLPTTPRGVVVWVHGGAWRHRSRRDDADRLAKCFVEAGYAFATVDHRYAPNPPDPDQPGHRHPAQAEDVSDAIAWLARHARREGYPHDRFLLVGHSSGAHLVTLAAVHPRLLTERGVDRHHVRAVASLDVRGYDIPRLLAAGDVDVARMYHNAFGRDPEAWRDASPQLHLPASPLAELLVVVRGDDLSRAIKRDFAAAWRQAGGVAQTLALPDWSHAEVRERLGDPSDVALTPAVLALFAPHARP